MSKSRRIPIVALIRTVFDVLVAVAATCWGFLSFALPWPGIAAGLGALAATVLVWALFLSVRPVLYTDRFARALVALVFLACGAAAALAIGVPLVLVALLFLAAAIISYFDVLAAAKA